MNAFLIYFIHNKSFRSCNLWDAIKANSLTSQAAIQSWFPWGVTAQPGLPFVLLMMLRVRVSCSTLATQEALPLATNITSAERHERVCNELVQLG